MNGQDIIGATQSTFQSSELKNNDLVSVRFDSDENKCTPITAANPVTIQVADQVENRIIKIDGPINPEVGKSATYQAIPVDNSIDWIYQWVISYTDGQEEMSAETSSTLVINSIRADLDNITVKQIALEGSCVNQDQNTASISTLPDPLPVELLYLKAKKNNQDILVEWATAMELNNSGFEVQVSLDAVNYRLLSFVPSKNPNFYTKQVYSFPDEENGKYGTRYYRLKQMDFDGSFKYFGPVTVKMNDPEERITTYPNPFLKEINLEIDAHETGSMHLIIINVVGSKVMEQTLEIKKGTNKEVLLLAAGLSPGVYTIITQMNGRINRIKLLKR